MPGFDSTGPVGYGPGTGRGMGLCGGGFGRGRRVSRGGGFGFRPWVSSRVATPSASDLKEEKEYLEQELEAINKEIANSEKK